jgi:hypothetical protein
MLLLLGNSGARLNRRLSHAERFVEDARRGAARDLLDRALNLAEIDQLVVATNDAAWAETLPRDRVTLDLASPEEPFHFGRRLAGLVEKYEVRRALYFGGASAPLLGQGALAEIVARLEERVVVTNNVHSSDWAAFAPAPAVVGLADQLERDNALAWVLAHDAEFRADVLPRSAATLLDIDTPTDAVIAAMHPLAGEHLRAVATAWARLIAPSQVNVAAAARVLAQEGGHVLIAGRVGAASWRELETRTACWVRVFAEERGMAASGRLARGEVRSLVGAFLDQVGPAAFFETLAGMAEAVFLDTRVLMAHRGGWPSAADRFASDLLCPDEVMDPFWREFTACAAAAPMPVVLGGHALMAGGLLALLEAMEVGVLVS